MKIVGKTGRQDIATVYIAKTETGKLIEFVESVQPPIPKEEKWVLIVSTLFGCPVKCKICDAGGHYQGKLSKTEIFEQIDFLVNRYYPDKNIPVKKFKIQFARIGEPAFNDAVIEVLKDLPERYNAPGLMPCISTIAPAGTDGFFEKLLKTKKKYYKGKFQLQFSIHTTDERLRDWLIPINKWNFNRIFEYGKAFYEDGDRKIALNFALGKGMPVDPSVLLRYFKPEYFCIKITPVNPTINAIQNQIVSYITTETEKYEVIERLRDSGYEVILSIGELEENQIGSNCGQYIQHYLNSSQKIKEGYTYPIELSAV
jgi:23S rRNA (adenine2503-C2)-methyltransferase